ncbi:MAG: hypothetical protein IKY12_00815, partial [Clostridia bacterium]|nr:hypothetical protein [Clostridia bacterium]
MIASASETLPSPSRSPPATSLVNAVALGVMPVYFVFLATRGLSVYSGSFAAKAAAIAASSFSVIALTPFAESEVVSKGHYARVTPLARLISS